MTKLLLIALVACSPVQEAKDLGADFAEESYCNVEHCGEVFLCSARDPGGAAVDPELCWIDSYANELETAMWEAGYTEIKCDPTPRGGALGWPCIYQCPGAKGCNAFDGCWCD